MHTIKTLGETQDQKQQLELSRQSFIVNTRLRMAETFLNTLIGRPDVDIVDEKFKEFLVDMSLDYANLLMTKLGILLPATNVE